MTTLGRGLGAALCLATLACGVAFEGDGAAPAEAGGPVGERAHERFQTANVELLNLLSAAADAGEDVASYQARLGPIVQTSITDMASAAEALEALVTEARAEFQITR
ncbi:MAG: hypothetical protein CL483_15420 [Acidobacteria bacterium]|nr:hypothetical protein [Acidobacteriota bacterium]|tara:strand:- start:385 stop:705 length:321 start_codon:yes stop_codon:yes gene_type:complete